MTRRAEPPTYLEVVEKTVLPCNTRSIWAQLVFEKMAWRFNSKEKEIIADILAVATLRG